MQHVLILRLIVKVYGYARQAPVSKFEIQALKDKFRTYPNLTIFINPVLAALEIVMRSWHKPAWTSIVHSFFDYLTNEIPNYIGTFIFRLYN